MPWIVCAMQHYCRSYKIKKKMQMHAHVLTFGYYFKFVLVAPL